MTSTYYQMVRLAASISVLINKNKPGTEVAPSAEWDEIVYCVIELRECITVDLFARWQNFCRDTLS